MTSNADNLFTESHSAPVSNDTITDCRSWLPWVEGDKSGNETYTTKSQIDSLLQCPEVVKTIEIRVPAGQTVLDLTGIVRFDQGLRILDGADLIYINAEQLEEVGNVFHLGGLPSLRVLNLPKLQSVGLLRLEDLPMLWNVTDPWVTSGLNITLEKPLLAEDYAIKVKNTSLSELVFRALSSQTNEGVIEINNNALLSSIWIQGWINGPDRVNISSNNQQLVVGFPDVQNLGTSFYISQASALHMPTVTSSTGSVILKYNYFTSLELPLITVSNELGITANNRLTKLDISQLRSLGVLSGNSQGILRIQDNGDLKTITLPANDLYANQAIWLQGYFTEYVTCLPCSPSREPRWLTVLPDYLRRRLPLFVLEISGHDWTLDLMIADSIVHQSILWQGEYGGGKTTLFPQTTCIPASSTMRLETKSRDHGNRRRVKIRKERNPWHDISLPSSPRAVVLVD